jgi:hypothetical protein
MNVVASNAAIWTTVERRRAAQHTLLYHSTDVTEEQHVSLKKFEERMSRMLVRLPPPLPETRLFQWVSSVDVYRAAMPEAAYPILLADDPNRTFHLLWEYEQVAPDDSPITATAIAGTDAECLIRHLNEATTIITLDELLFEVVTNLKTDRIFSSPVKDAHHLDMEVDLLFPPDYGPGEGETLGIYLLLDTLAHWPKFRKSCDAFLARGGRVVALFSTIGGAAIELEDSRHSWILESLTRFFFNDADRVELEIIPSATPPKHPHSPSLRNRAPETTTSYCTGFIVRLGSRCNTGE